MSTTTLARIDTKQIYKTPRGYAIWPKLIVPNTKYDPAGVYEIWMKFDPKDEAAFFDQMMDLNEIAYQETLQKEARTQAERQTAPWKNKDNTWQFHFKLKAGGVNDGEAWTNKPPKLFDSHGDVIKDPDPLKLQIGNGSEVRVFFQVRPYYVSSKAGITLRLKAVQLLKLVELDDAKHYGVTDENEFGGGYVYEAPKPSVAEPVLPLNGTAAEPEIPMDDDDPHAPIADNRIIDDDIPF